MKKSMILTLALVFVLGIAGTAFAANPFVDVPAKHWAYDAVAKLAQAGIVDGYGDGTFKGDKTMTRYEMAQIVAKAMARSDKANAEQKAAIDKLSVEFSTELNNMGVRVAALEQKAAADRVNFTGMFRTRYQNEVKDGTSSAHHLQGLLQINANAKINDEWTAGMRWEGYKNYRNDMGYANGSRSIAVGSNTPSGYTSNQGQYDLTRAWVTGPVMPGVKLTAGKFGETIGSGILHDDALTGAKVEFGNQLKVKLGEYQNDSWFGANNTYADGVHNANGTVTADPKNMTRYGKIDVAQLDYAFSKATLAKASYIKVYSKITAAPDIKAWDLGVTSKLSPDWTVYGGYFKGDIDDSRAYAIGVRYRNADMNKVGSYQVALEYQDFQNYTISASDSYMVSPGEKAPVLSFIYVPMKNTMWKTWYYDAKEYKVNSQSMAEGTHHKFFRTQVEMYF